MNRSVKFDLILNSRKYEQGGKAAVRTNKQITESTRRAGNALKAAVGAFSVGIVVNEMRNWVAAARDSNKTAAQTATVLKSTHDAAGLTADQFAKLASQISKSSAVDDDLIQSGENIIATFTEIHGDVFKKTTQAAVDMTAAMNHGEVTQEGLQSSAIQLGKALNDPLKGLTALQRVGVTFSAQQKEQIADFVKHGQVAKAQGVILAEVNKEFGGSAAAAVTPAKQLAVTWGNMQEVLGNLLIPAIDRGAQILNAILGVVDRDRTAFGVLFGVLGTGAAIIGTLIVAEKVHAAVTDAMRVASSAAAVTQKGLNLVFGVTKVQAEAAAVAEGELGVATAASGVAAGKASVSYAALAGRLGLVTAAAAAGAYQGNQFEGSLQKIHERSNPLAAALDTVFTKLHLYGDAVKSGAASTKDLNIGQQLGATAANAFKGAQQQAAKETETGGAKAAAAAEKIKTLSGSLKDARGELAQNRASMAKTIESYDGLISKSKVTASEVIKDLRNQTANFKTYSSDVHRLIKAGVDPAAIQELSEKGPQYVHALATGSNKQLLAYRQAWHDRQVEVKGGFAKSMQEQFQDLVRKMRAMQREINKLKGKTVDVTASTKVDPNVLKVFTAAGGRVRMMARGGRITAGSGPTADDVLIRASKGETVVSAGDSSRPDFQEWAKRRGIPGFARGGAVYAAELGMRNRASGLMVASTVRAAKLYQQMAGLDIPGGGGGAGAALARQVAAWTVAALHRSLGEAAGWFRRLMFESGGNPRAINRTDSNWLAGHPSVGIAQVIRGTFQANAGRYRNVGPFAYGVSMNPYANSYAGGHYAVGRYGSLAAVDPRTRPIGYDRGGWLPPGLSTAVNTTGKPEPVGPHVTNIYVDRRLLARIVNDGGLQNARLT